MNPNKIQFFCAALILLIANHKTSGQEMTIDSIETAWKQRTDSFQAVEVSWEEIGVANLKTSTTKRSLLLQGDCIKETRSGERNELQGGTVNDSSTIAWNGKERGDLSTGGEHALAVLNSGEKKVSSNNNLRPILLYVFGNILENGGVDLQRYKIVSRREVVDECPCIRLQANSRGSKNWEGDKTDIWVDARQGNGFRAVRLTTYFGTRKRFDVKISYSSDGDNGFPSSWSGATFDVANGKMLRSFKATISAFVRRMPVPIDEFSINIPEGAILGDYRGIKSHSEEVPKTYLQGKAGSARLISRDKMSRASSYSEVIDAVKTDNNTEWNVLVIRGLLAVTVVIAILFASFLFKR